jgi:hypothetical protein
LAGNNFAKLAAYRRTLPFKSALGILLLTLAGSALSNLLVAAPEGWVSAGVLLMGRETLMAKRNMDPSEKTLAGHSPRPSRKAVHACAASSCKSASSRYGPGIESLCGSAGTGVVF